MPGRHANSLIEDLEHSRNHEDASSNIRIPSRSPQPYHRRKVDDNLTIDDHAPNFAPPRSRSHGSSPLTHSESENGVETEFSHFFRGEGKAVVISPSESGTEADDEGYGFIKALPAPLLIPRKGLRDNWRTGARASIDFEINTPPLTPSALDVFSAPASEKTQREKEAAADEGKQRAKARSVKKRRAEFRRRASEVVLLAVIGILALTEDHVWQSLKPWRKGNISVAHPLAPVTHQTNLVELWSHLSVVAVLCALYPARLLAYKWTRATPRMSISACMRVPVSFDPAPLLYPIFLPPMVAISLLPVFSSALLPNLVLGLAALPFQLIPHLSSDVYCSIHWLLSVVPMIISDHTDVLSITRATKPYTLKVPSAAPSPEFITLLYPLHQALLPVLRNLTTTSLLPAELQLVSISLINLLIFAEAPQSVILCAILWTGGLGLILFTTPVLRWSVALARIPRWRLRRVGRFIQARQSFIGTLNQALARSRSVSQIQPTVESDADDGTELRREKPLLFLQSLREEFLGPPTVNLSGAVPPLTRSPIGSVSKQPNSKISHGSASKTTRRRYTMPNVSRRRSSSRSPKRSDRSRSSLGCGFLSLTPQQAQIRKWAYGGYVYAIMITLVLGPIRTIVARYALDGHEPFGWALGYLFGNIRAFRSTALDWNMTAWLPLPPLRDRAYADQISHVGRADYLRYFVFGEANTRLWIAAYCLLILTLGMITVLRLSAVVEVDTRRKVFHGMMVAMLLPTTFIDPTFIALALGLILAIFLILDLLRASQLPPLSKPLAYFLTPYVDGRDLRGPVVVSHIFLLIGCAVPLWLSLAGTSTFGESPWKDFEVRTRDVSMLAGVVCVGMGDAAASLIGRRYGRRKWPWAGGKSLEGSAAFALAVTIGLSFSKFWLRLGQWDECDGRATSWPSIVTKAIIAACGASFMEAVLTGGNDNVVVPIALWLLVRAVGV